MAAPLPDFTDIALFPTFLTIPEQDPAAPPSVAALPPGKGPWYLIAQIKDNMTINKPTLVLTDRGANPFALVWEGLGRDDLDLKGLGFKKGYTAVIPYAWRTKPADEGKRGFVRVEKSDARTVRSVPGPLERVLALGGKAKGAKCETCGGEGQDGLKSCTGCERVGYCSKVSLGLFSSLFSEIMIAKCSVQECQLKGWNEGGHKGDCKILKALNGIFT